MADFAKKMGRYELVTPDGELPRYEFVGGEAPAPAPVGDNSDADYMAKVNARDADFMREKLVEAGHIPGEPDPWQAFAQSPQAQNVRNAMSAVGQTDLGATQDSAENLTPPDSPPADLSGEAVPNNPPLDSQGTEIGGQKSLESEKMTSSMGQPLSVQNLGLDNVVANTDGAKKGPPQSAGDMLTPEGTPGELGPQHFPLPDVSSEEPGPFTLALAAVRKYGSFPTLEKIKGLVGMGKNAWATTAKGAELTSQSFASFFDTLNSLSWLVSDQTGIPREEVTSYLTKQFDYWARVWGATAKENTDPQVPFNDFAINVVGRLLHFPVGIGEFELDKKGFGFLRGALRRDSKGQRADFLPAIMNGATEQVKTLMMDKMLKSLNVLGPWARTLSGGGLFGAQNLIEDVANRAETIHGQKTERTISSFIDSVLQAVKETDPGKTLESITIGSVLSRLMGGGKPAWDQMPKALPEEVINSKMVKDIEASFNKGDATLGDHAVALKFAERQPELANVTSIETIRQFKIASDEAMRAAGLEGQTGIVVGQHDYVVKDGSLQSAIKMYFGYRPSETLIHEIMHRNLDADSNQLLRDAWNKAKEKGDNRSFAEWKVDEALKFYVEHKLWESPPETAWGMAAKKTGDYVRNLAARVGLIEGNHVPWAISDMFYKAAGYGKVDTSGWTPEMVGESNQVKQTPLGFYSKLEETLDRDLPGKGSADQYAKTLESWAKSGKFKQEELKWSGVLDWLKEQNGKVSKSDVLDYLRANNVEVKEVVKGAPIQNGWYFASRNFTSERYSTQEEASKEMKKYLQSPESDKDVSLIFQRDVPDSTEFSQWQTPGGDNYRELLLTLPKDRTPYHQYAKEMEQKYGHDYGEGMTESEHEKLYNLHDQIGENFISTHYSEPNILAHVRFNERTDADGKKVLYLEEIQSDWGQKGREEGFKGDYKYSIELPSGEVVKKFKTKSEADAYAKENWTADNMLSVRPVQGHPAAPFVTSTGSWTMLAVKRMIRWAAEHGFDRIAWTPGDVQAERYDLSKQISRIEYEPDMEDGELNGKYNFYAVGKNGGRIIDEDSITLDRIKEIAGREIAEKIKNDEGKPEESENQSAYRDWRALTGLDLKVGGEGMKGFYGQPGEGLGIVGSEINKYAKKWGVQVGETNIPGEKYQDTSDPTGKTVGQDNLRSHSLDITPEMRKEVMEKGQTSFQVAPVGVTPSELNWSLNQLGRGEIPAEAKERFSGLMAKILSKSPPVEEKTFAGNIRLAKYYEDRRSVLQHTSETLPGELEDARGGVVSDKEVDRRARELANDTESNIKRVLNREPGQAFNAWEAKAARFLLDDTSAAVLQRAEDISSGKRNSDQDVAEFAQLVEFHSAIQAQVAGLTAESGRTLRQFRQKITSNSDASMRVSKMNFTSLVDSVGGRGNFVDMANNLVEIVNNPETTPEQINNAIAEYPKRNWQDWLFAWRYGAMLSNPATHIRNTVGNAIIAAMSVPERWIAHKIGVVNRLLGDETPHVDSEEAQALFSGYWGSQLNALKLAGIALRTGQSQFGKTFKYSSPGQEKSAVDVSGVDKGIDLLWNTLNINGKVLGAEDEFFKYINYSGEMGAMAHRIARAEGLEGTQKFDRIKELLNNPTEEMYTAAEDAANNRTLNDTITSKYRFIVQGLNSFAGKFILPFPRVPYNIFRYANERTPFALLMPKFYAELNAGGARRELALAKITLGSTLMGVAAMMAHSGLITGGGPHNPDERNVWLQNFQPYSFKVGNKWISYDNLAEPVGSFLAISADYHDIVTDWRAGNIKPETLITGALVAYMKNFADKSFLKGIIDTVQAVEDPERRMTSFVSSQLGSFVPTFPAGMAANMQDPEAKLAWSVFDGIRAKLPNAWGDPIGKKAMSTKRDFWGNPVIPNELAPGWQTWQPIKVKENKSEEADAEMWRLRMGVQMPLKVQNFGKSPVELSAEQYSRMLELAGQEIQIPFNGVPMNMKDAVDNLVSSPGYQRLVEKSDGPEGLAAAQIKKVIGMYRERAKMELMKEYPDIGEKIDEIADRRSEGLHGRVK